MTFQVMAESFELLLLLQSFIFQMAKIYFNVDVMIHLTHHQKGCMVTSTMEGGKIPTVIFIMMRNLLMTIFEIVHHPNKNSDIFC